MIKVGIAGANGKMGRAIIDVIKHEPDFCYQKGLIRQQNSNSLKETNNLTDFFIDIDIAIIFATSGIKEILNMANKKKTPIVMCSTGFLIDESEYNMPFIYSPNTSDGMNMIFDFLKSNKTMLCKNYKIKITEYHHKDKKDSPSGTTKKIMQILNETNIDTKIVRKDDLNAKIQITFQSDDEEFNLVHKAENRNVFAKGTLKIAKKLLSDHS